MMGDKLQKEGWDCPEAVELNIWAHLFRCNEDKFDPKTVLELGKPFSELLDSIAQLRHTAVHRVRVSASKVQQFLIEAESLANLLHNNTATQTLSRLRREAQHVVDDIGRNKDLLESTVKEKLQEIEARRCELDSLECSVVEDMLREDKEYEALASANLEHALSAPDAIQRSAPASEYDTSSEGVVEEIS
jgi:hypothetical protein